MDLANYVTTTGKTYRLCEVNAPIPPGVGVFPVITSIALAAGEVSPGKGLGGRDRITITGVDPQHGGEGIDPYLHKRRTGQTAGLIETLIAINLYHPGRQLYIRTGYVDHEGTLYVAGMTWQRYRIDSIEVRNGQFTIQALDLLAAVEKKLGDDGRVLVRWSGTEAKLRVMIEGPNSDKIKRMADAICVRRLWIVIGKPAMPIIVSSRPSASRAMKSCRGAVAWESTMTCVPMSVIQTLPVPSTRRPWASSACFLLALGIKKLYNGSGNIASDIVDVR